jgi:hypothetical protein
MKQRITVEQLQELTEEQKQRLREWWKPEPGDIMLDIKMGCLETLVEGGNGKAIIEHIKSDSKARFLPLLSIGQMIELIESKDDCINITKLLTDIDHKELWGWETALRHLRKSSCDIELCDALWQIVKEVL